MRKHEKVKITQRIGFQCIQFKTNGKDMYKEVI